MKWYRLFRAFQVMACVGDWFEKAMADGKIDSQEAGELVSAVGEILGFEVKLEGSSKK